MNGFTTGEENGVGTFRPLKEDPGFGMEYREPVFPTIPLMVCSLEQEGIFIRNFYYTFVAHKVRANRDEWPPKQLETLKDMYLQYVTRWNSATGRGVTSSGFDDTYNKNRERRPNEPPISWTRWCDVLFEEHSTMRNAIQSRIDKINDTIHQFNSTR
jgi:hypothetical protein